MYNFHRAIPASVIPYHTFLCILILIALDYSDLCRYVYHTYLSDSLINSFETRTSQREPCP